MYTVFLHNSYIQSYNIDEPVLSAYVPSCPHMSTAPNDLTFFFGFSIIIIFFCIFFCLFKKNDYLYKRIF